MRGDKIKIDLGYSFFKTNGSTFNRAELTTETNTIFNGYISKIKNSTPFVLECEDIMFLLKQSLLKDKEYYGKDYTIEKMLKEMISESSFEDVKKLIIKTDNFKTKIDKFRTENATISNVLKELRDYFNMESFIRVNKNSTELRCGIIRYYPEDSKKEYQFHFQKNIINDYLDYNRKDDLRVGIKAISINEKILSELNSKGENKVKKERLEVIVGDKNGEIKTLFFYGIKTESELKVIAEKKLKFVKYEGFKGSFTTFALPKVNHGDSVVLIDNRVTERSGTYLVKSVQTSYNENGIRQTIELDIRIDGLTTNEILEFKKNGG
jgi:hypothetical protein